MINRETTSNNNNDGTCMMLRMCQGSKFPPQINLPICISLREISWWIFRPRFDISLFFFSFNSRGPSGCVIRLWQHPRSQPQWQQWCSTYRGGHGGREKPRPECHPPSTNTSWGKARQNGSSVTLSMNATLMYYNVFHNCWPHFIMCYRTNQFWLQSH